MVEARPFKSTCKHCGSEFYHRKWDRGLYCSRDCVDAAGPLRVHGKSGTREHATWLDMRNRCRNPKAHNYHRYGARGIKVCERWDSFENFLADMRQRPGNGYSIERVNNDGNYEPSNCRWATKAEQNKNRGNSYTAEEDRIIRDAIARGLNFKQAAELIGKSHSSVSQRAFRIGLKAGFRPRGRALSNSPPEGKS